MTSATFDAKLSWADDPAGDEPDADHRTLRRRLRLSEPGEAFGLLERCDEGWTLCIPSGAQAEVSVGDDAVDLRGVPTDPAGERRLRLAEGLRARVVMGEFRFEVRPAA